MILLSYSFKYKIFFFLLHRHCTKIQAQLKVTTSLLVLILSLQRANNHVVKSFVVKRSSLQKHVNFLCVSKIFLHIKTALLVIARDKQISRSYTKPSLQGQCTWCGHGAPGVTVGFLASRLVCPYYNKDIPAVLMNVLERFVQYCSKNTL